MTGNANLLVVEDNRDFSEALEILLSGAGFLVSTQETARETYHALEKNRFDLVLLDLTLPDGSGPAIIPELLSRQPQCPIIVLTGHNDAQQAVSALRMGASDYLTKPVKREVLLSSISRALESAHIRLQIEDFRSQNKEIMVGDSPAWCRTLELVFAAARSPRTTVLLTGEPGAGKEVAASLIHHTSQRSKGPYITVNAGGLPGSLLESLLFGHEAGAFTGAQQRKKGFFEMADQGTLFLDEVGELPLDLQVKLLRVLEGHPYRRLGSERSLKPDFRLIGATNRDLKEAVKNGSFRADLYHRLKVFEISIPPLRERVSDIERLAFYFLAKLSTQMGFSTPSFSPDALTLLSNYQWPGNVRELCNVVERALILSQGEQIKPRHLPQEIQKKPVPPAENLSNLSLVPLTEDITRLDNAIQAHILRIYAKADNNVSRAAVLLGISRLTLRKKLKMYGVK